MFTKKGFSKKYFVIFCVEIIIVSAFGLMIFNEAVQPAEGGIILYQLPSGETIYNIDWKPGGNNATLVGEDRALFTFNKTTNTYTEVQTGLSSLRYCDISWKPDGSSAFIVGYDNPHSPGFAKNYFILSSNG